MSVIHMSSLSQRRFILKAVAAGLASAALSACSPDKPQFKSIDITGADYASGFSLKDHNSFPRSLPDFKGKVVVVFFGFTQCPDVCPTAMTELAEVKRKLGSQGARLQGIFITVDPERDTEEVLKAYMANFDPGFLALRPTLAQLPELAKTFKIYYKKNESKTAGSYTMDHSAGSYVFDPAGRVRLYTRYGSGVEGLAADIALLLK
jgi:protein SCO1/2